MMVDEAPVIDHEHPGRVDEIVGRSVDTVNLVYLPGTPRGKQTFQARLMNSEEDEFSLYEARPIYKMDLNWTKDPKKNTPMFKIPYRPHTYNTMREYYGILLKCHDLEESGQTDTPEYFSYRSRCRDLDPDRERKEYNRPFSPWYLMECLSRSKSDKDAQLIKTEVDGVEADDEFMLFSSDNLDNQPICEPNEYGDFEDIQENHPLVVYTRQIGRLEIWKRPGETGPGDNPVPDIDASGDPVPHYYMITTDSSCGIGGDYSVAMVWDVTSWPVEQVAVLRDNRVGAMELGEYVWALWRWYTCDKDYPPFVCPEQNKEGLLTISKMLELGIPPQWIRKHRDTGSTDPSHFGFSSAGGTRISLFAAFQEIFESLDQKIIIHSSRTKHELSTIPSDVEKDKKKYEPESGHDDCVITTALIHPALLAYNKQLFGREFLDCVGWRLSERREMDLERKARATLLSYKQDMTRHKRVPIYRNRVA